MRKHLPLAVLGGMAGAAALAALPTLLAYNFVHPPRRRHTATPRSRFKIGYRRVRLKSVEGHLLSAWYVPAPEGVKAKGVVVICHGYHGCRACMLPYLRFLHDAGYAAVLFDFRAHGWSGGKQSTFGVHEVGDAQAAVNWAMENEETKDLPLVVLGESMGGSVSLLLAAADTRVRAVVADSAFAKFDNAVEARFDLIFGKRVASMLRPRAQAIGEKMIGMRCADIGPEDVMEAIAPRPVLLIAGLRDRLVVPENSRRLLAASPGNAQLWEVPNASHVTAVYTGEEYGRRVVGFLDSALSA